MTANRMTARTFLAREIKLAREAKGISRDKLAQVVYVSEGLIRAWESGRRLPQADHLAKAEEYLGTNGYLVRMREDMVKNEPMPEYMGRWTFIEGEATSLGWYEPLLVPGLFQTADYARAVFASSGRRVDDMEEQIQTRMERQKVLDPEHNLTVTIILDECVLERPMGGKKTMHEQMLRLLELAEQDNVNIQIVPLAVGGHAGLAGGLAIATMDGHEFAYVDDAFSGDVLEDPQEVAAMKRVWATLSVEALPARQSIERIRQAAEKWKP